VVLFFRVVDVVFYRGFCGIVVRRTWYLGGKTWWDCGENVVENDIKSALKITPSFLKIS
jgi:hypothetical protein